MAQAKPFIFQVNHTLSTLWAAAWVLPTFATKIVDNPHAAQSEKVFGWTKLPTLKRTTTYI